MFSFVTDLLYPELPGKCPTDTKKDGAGNYLSFPYVQGYESETFSFIIYDGETVSVEERKTL
jgi:hypothetical protein